MWDPRYGELATMRLAADRAAARRQPGAADDAPRPARRRVRRAVGARLVSWGERLLTPAAAQ
jgi:hypothetical protein